MSSRTALPAGSYASPNKGIIPAVFAQLTLPHSNPKLPPGMLYSRKCGSLTLNIVPTSKKYGIPYGTIPRVVLAWICTEAVRTRSPELFLGRSQREFMQKLDLGTGGRDIARLKDQSMRLFRAAISVEWENDDYDESYRCMISKGERIFWKSTESGSEWQSILVLSEDFFNEIVKRPVPINLDVFHSLTRSPLAMDIYVWLTYRVFTIKSQGKAAQARIPWVSLMEQFGVGYSPDDPVSVRNFKAKFLDKCAEVLDRVPYLKDYVGSDKKCLVLGAPAEKAIGTK